MEVTFNNVTITVAAVDEKAAYDSLCEALGTLECDWQTDVFATDAEPDKQRQTSELWPQFPAEFTFDAEDLQDTPR